MNPFHYVHTRGVIVQINLMNEMLKETNELLSDKKEKKNMQKCRDFLKSDIILALTCKLSIFG